jgi:uncharacterized membrane protein
MIRFIISLLIFYFLIYFFFKVLRNIFSSGKDLREKWQKSSENFQENKFYKGDIEDAKFKDVDEK